MYVQVKNNEKEDEEEKEEEEETKSFVSVMEKRKKSFGRRLLDALLARIVSLSLARFSLLHLLCPRRALIFYMYKCIYIHKPIQMYVYINVI